MVTRKGLHIKPKLTNRQKRRSELHKQYGNPDWLSRCISYCNNGKWIVRDKQNNNKVVETFNNEDDYFTWYYGVLYDE